jgi:hypothetical protein
MDHHEKHHEHHRKEREERIEHEKEREREQDKLPVQIHPAWFMALGVVLIVAVILLWTFAL